MTTAVLRQGFDCLWRRRGRGPGGDGRPGTGRPGWGGPLLAMPLAFALTVALVAVGAVPLLWALPAYALLGAALVVLFALIG